MKSIVCPISKNTANQSVVRLTGFIIASLGILFAVTKLWIIPLFMIGDFYIRACTQYKFSPVSFIASKISKALDLKVIKIDKAPKVFAARIGLIFSVFIFGFTFISPVVAAIIALVLTTFALLEAIGNICVGCIIYTYLVLPRYQKQFH